MCEDSPEVRQSNELIALKSIYGDDVVENRERDGETGWRPLDVSLTLLPLHDSAGAHCSLTLRFQCCRDYPDKPPKISVQSVGGLSVENAAKLLKELEVTAAQQCGEVMIFQLAHHTQQFLHSHNKPTLSFYEQMVQQQIESEEMKQRDLLVKENEEAMKMRAEILKRQETLREVECSEEVGDDAPRLLWLERY